MQISECINNIPIRINGETHILPQIFVSNQKVRYKFILGLNFILWNNGSILIAPNGVNFFKKSTFIQPKYEKHILSYKKNIFMLEKNVDIKFVNSLLEEEKVENTKELKDSSKLELENVMHKVKILDDEEIEKYLEDAMSVAKELECLECEK